MEFKPPRNTVATGPEAVGSRRLKKYMEGQGWYLKKLHGGAYQSGMPDYVAWHPRYGQRWIEMKAPGGKLRHSQISMFRIMEKYGQHVYVLESEKHYGRLFSEKGNWFSYVRGF